MNLVKINKSTIAKAKKLLKFIALKFTQPNLVYTTPSRPKKG